MSLGSGWSVWQAATPDTLSGFDYLLRPDDGPETMVGKANNDDLSVTVYLFIGSDDYNLGRSSLLVVARDPDAGKLKYLNSQRRQHRLNLMSYVTFDDYPKAIEHYKDERVYPEQFKDPALAKIVDEFFGENATIFYDGALQLEYATRAEPVLTTQIDQLPIETSYALVDIYQAARRINIGSNDAVITEYRWISASYPDGPPNHRRRIHDSRP